MFNNSCYENQVNTMPVQQRDYSYYENKNGSKYDRRCIDGRITGCGNCVGYCQYSEHSGFLTIEQRKEHNCIGKGCFHYLPKIKQQKPKKVIDNRPREVVNAASDLISGFEGIRIINACRSLDGGWLVKYISITNEYSIEAIENMISKVVGEAATMVNLNYDFDRAAKLIFAI